MSKVGNWYKLLGMLAIAFQAEQDLEKTREVKKVGDKDYWPKYASLPKGCKIYEFTKKFKDADKKPGVLAIQIVSSNQKNANKKYDKLITELKDWDGSQKELGLIIKNYNKFCAPIKVIE